MRLREDRGRINFSEELLNGDLQAHVWAFEHDEMILSAGVPQRRDAGDFLQEGEKVLLLLLTRDANYLQVPRGEHFRRAAVL